MKFKYKPYQITLELIGIVILAAMFVYLFAAWPALPDRVPMHFNAAGEIDGWGGKGSLLILPITTALLYALMSGAMFLPEQLWNIPVSPARRTEKTWRRTRDLVLVLKLEITAMFFAISYYIVQGVSMPVLFAPAILVVVFATIALYIWLIVKSAEKASKTVTKA